MTVADAQRPAHERKGPPPAELPCPDCGGAMRLQVKPSAWRGASTLVYLCERRRSGCKGLASTHPNGWPLGTPANAETRRARMLTHELFDALWKDAERMYPGTKSDPKGQRHVRRVARSRAYAWLAQQLGIAESDCHISMMDLPTLRRAYSALRGVTAGEIRAWAQARKPERKT